jgi:hypothetical protein
MVFRLGIPDCDTPVHPYVDNGFGIYQSKERMPLFAKEASPED